MIVMIVVVGSVSFLAAFIGALIALKVEQGYLHRTLAQQQAWENAQESHQHSWEVRQEKDAAVLESRLTTQVQEVNNAWEAWIAKDRERIETLTKQFEESEAQLHVKRELARLPHIENAPLSLDAKSQHKHSPYPDWRPPILQGANLAEHDLSHRYLGHADLRNAHLLRTNFFMSDLAGASLAGANLTGADLAGANLSGADLRSATLTGANLLVTDLHGAILIGANLLHARNLTPQQVHTTIYDSTTQLDAEVDITMPRIRGAQAISRPTDLLVEEQENAPTEACDPPSPRPEFNGRRQLTAS